MYKNEQLVLEVIYEQGDSATFYFTDKKAGRFVLMIFTHVLTFLVQIYLRKKTSTIISFTDS